MKKFTFIVALAAMMLTSNTASAQSEKTWDFTNWSEETTENLSYAENWEYITKEKGYRNKSALREDPDDTENVNGITLVVDDVTIPETDGLLVFASKYNSIYLSPENGYIKFNRASANDLTLIVPGLSAGSQISIDCETAKSSAERTIIPVSMDNLEVVSGGSVSTERQTSVWQVKEDVVGTVDIAFQATVGAVFVYSIKATGISGTGIASVKADTKADGKWYTLDGREVSAPTKGVYIHNGKKVVK